MRSIHKRTLGIVLFFLSWSFIHGTHISGANIEYECLGSDQYLITLNIFQDCADGNVNSTQSIRVVPDCNNLFFATTLSLTSNTEVSQLCSALISESSCNGGLYPGKRHLTYEGMVTIPSTCPEYRVMWKQNYRTPSVNVDNTTNLVFYTDAKIRPQDAGCNDSPQITIQQVPYVCVGQVNSYNFGAVDVEGDSLVFSFTPALYSPAGNGYSPVAYEPGYSGMIPIPGASINAETGVLTFTAPAIGEYTIAVLVEQFDVNGTFIGSVTIDVNIVADICPNPPPTLVDDSFVNFIGNATLTGPHTIEMCYGEYFCADVVFTSSIPASDIQVESNLAQVLPGATLTFSGGNPSTATVCWEANQFGLDGTVVLIANDDLCPIPGIVSFSFDIDVNEAVYAGPDTFVCSGESTQIQAVGDTQFSWEVLEGDPMVIGSNFSCNPCNDPVASPSVTTTYIVTGSGTNAQCFNQDTITVGVALDHEITTTQVGCDGNEGSLSIEISSGSGDYSIDFEGSLIDLNSNTFDSLSIAEGIYQITLLDNGLSCSIDETVAITSSTLPPPDAGPDPTNALCVLTYPLDGTSSGGSLQWTAVGPGIADFTPNANVQDPTVAVSAAGSYTFYLNETQGLCSLTDSVTIDFDGPIEVFAGNDTVVCGAMIDLSVSQNYGSGSWVSTNPLVIFDPDVSSPDVTVTVPTFGSYTFFWSADGGNGCTAADDVQVDFLALPVADAGEDLVSCLSTDTLTAIAQNGSGLWTWPSGVNVNNAIDPNAVVTFTGTAGTYSLTWTVSNAACSTSDTIELEYIPSTVADAGFDQANICGLSSSLTANGSVGQWSPQAGVTFTDSTSPTSSVSVSSPGVYMLEWDLGSGVCATSDEVVLVFNAQPVAQAGPDQTICSNSTVLEAIPSAGTGEWTVPSEITLTDASDAMTAISTSAFGTYNLTWTETTITGCISSDEVSITFIEQPTADAGSDITLCGNSTVVDAIPSVGTGTWTLPTGITASSLNDPNATLTSTVYGSQLLVWTEDNGNGCTSSDEVVVTFTEQPSAQAGADSSLCGNQFELQAIASVGTGLWTLPADLSVDDLNSPTATLTASEYGTYTLTWTEDNGNGCISSDAVSLSFIEQPNALAGMDTSLCGNSVQMSAIPSIGIGSWSTPIEITTDDGNSPTAIISSSVYGTYTLTWTEDNGNGCVSSDDVQVTFNFSPVADAGEDQVVCGTEVEVSASASVGIGQWSGPSEISFANINAPFTSISTSDLGTYTLYWQETSGTCQSIDSVTINFADTPMAIAGNYGPVCGSQVQLSANIPTVGTASWVFPSGISGDEEDPSALITASASGSYDLQWITQVGQCSDTSVTTIQFNPTPIAEAGFDQSVCGLETEMEAPLIEGAGQWELPLELSGNINDPLTEISSTGYGTYTLFWIIQDALGCTAIDSVHLNFVETPIVDAGIDLSICGNSAALEATSTLGIGEWSSDSEVSFNDVNSSSTLASGALGNHVLYWTSINQGLCVGKDSLDIEFKEVPIAQITSVPAAICGLEAIIEAEYSLNGAAGEWQGSTGITFSAPNSESTTVTSSQYGVQDILWIEETEGCRDTAIVELQFDQLPTISAGPDTELCGLTFDLQASLDLGEGNWSGPVSFNDPSDSQTSAVASSFGTYELIWTVMNGACSTSDEVSVQFLESPIANAGEDQDICGTQVQLSAVPSSGTGMWSFPTGLILSDVNDAEALASSSFFGEAVFTWTEDNGVCSTSDNMVIQFLQTPNANAGTDLDQCGLTGELGAQASIGTGTWSGPLNIEFSDVNDPSSTFNSSIPGNYTVTWTEVNGICVDQESLNIQLNEVPEAYAGEDAGQCGTTYTLQAVPSVGIGSWSGSSELTFFPSANAPNPVLTSSSPGDFTLTWTEQNGACMDTDNVNISFFDSPDTLSSSINCLNGNTQFQVVLDLFGGDPGSYVSIGDNGTFSGSIYSSSILDIQDSYSFTITDENECGVIQIEGEASCPSLSNAGILDLDTVHACPGESAMAIVLSTGFLDPDDVQAFYLHDAPFGIGTIFSISNDPSFSLQGGMEVDEVYYISSVVGNDDGTGQPDLDDEGTDISVAVPVVFHDNPEFSGIPVILNYCAGDEVFTSIELIGSPTFTVNYALDGVEYSSDVEESGIQPFTFPGGELLVWSTLSDRYCTTQLDATTELEELAIPSLTTQAELSFCEGSSESLDIQFEGQGPWQFSWSNDSNEGGDLISEENSLQFTPTTSGQYTFSGLSDENCTSSAIILSQVEILELPAVDAGPDTEVCQGETLQIGSEAVPGYTYQWTPSEQLDDLNSAEPFIHLDNASSEPQLFTFHLTVGDDNCYAYDEVTITWNPLPQNTSIEGETELCLGDSTMLTAMGGYSYSWEIDSSDSSSAMISVSPLEDILYEVAIINEFGCSVSESIELIVRPLPEVDLLSNQTAGCPPLSIEVLNLAQVSSLTNCQWSLSSGGLIQNSCESASAILQNSGNYVLQLTVSDIYGCQGFGESDTITVNDIQASVLTYPDVFTMDDTLFQAISTSSSPHMAEWFLEGESIGTGVSTILPLDVPRPDYYELCLVVMSEEGCLDSVCTDIEVSSNVKVWVPTAFTPNGDELNTGFTPVIDGKEYVTDYNLQVYDRRGVKVFETNKLDTPWYGSNSKGNENPQGVFHWVISMNIFGEAYPREYRGTVTIVR